MKKAKTLPVELSEEAKMFNAEKLLQMAKQKRIDECTKEVNEILKKYNCTFDIRAVLRSNRCDFEVQIILNP